LCFGVLISFDFGKVLSQAITSTGLFQRKLVTSDHPSTERRWKLQQPFVCCRERTSGASPTQFVRGAEGRAESIYFFGRCYYNRAPFYFFPSVLAVKIPIGLLALVAIGFYLLFTRSIPGQWLTLIHSGLGFAVLLLIVLASGASYAGIRHALPAVPALVLCAALAVHKTIASRSLVLRVTVFLATGKVSRQQRGFEPVRMPPPS
jgi:hypothetical protein